MNLIELLATCLLAFPLAADRPVTVRSEPGQDVSGNLIAVRAEQLQLQTENGDIQLPLDSIRSLIFAQPDDSSRLSAHVMLQLIDGTTLRPGGLQVADRRVQLVSEEIAAAQIDPGQIRAIRFLAGGSTEMYDQQWQEIADNPAIRADALVIRRDQALDWLEGVVGQITDEQIQFEFESRRVQVNRQRVEGILFYHAAGGELDSTLCAVITANGSRIIAHSIETDDQLLSVVTSGGSRLAIRLDDVREIDFDLGRFVYLSQLEPTTVGWTPLLTSPLVIEARQRQDRPRIDIGFADRPLQLSYVEENDFVKQQRTQQFDHGIAIKGGWRMVYRLDGEFAELSGHVGFAPYANANGSVTLRITGDGKTLWEQDLQNSEAIPRRISIPVHGVQRLILEVDYLDGRDVGDILHLCDMKVSR